MKRWGLYQIFNLCLVMAFAGGSATSARATETSGLSLGARDHLNGQVPDLLGQADQVLSLGSTGAAVKDLQAMLALLGYYSGAVDGAYEQLTLAAVRQFQTDAGLAADGIVGALTWRRLLPTPATLTEGQEPRDGAETSAMEDQSSEATSHSDVAAQTVVDLPTLRLDDTGADVSRLQNRLTTLNFYAGPIDGVFGFQTEQAVERFQRQSGLEIDGIVGPGTWLELFR